jgi:phthiocerol/phenolphthiocerol synthesis type-I polyketide synthase E
VLTKGAVAVGLETPSAEAAMLSGAAAGIRRECRGFDVRVIDVEQSIAMTTLLAELGQDQALVAYRGARRFVRRWHRSQADGPRICANGMHVVVTGGLGGLGRACATRLIAEWHAQVTVIGRRALADIPSAARDWLAQNDSNLRYVQADITDQARLSAVLTQPVDLLLHCAGHVENSALADVTAASVGRVLDPKCAGAQALSAVLDARLTVYFSSLSAVTGANKAVDYSAANAYLDAYATAQSNTGRETISIGWDGWYETGMAADAGLVVSDSVRSRALGTQEAVNALMDALMSGGSSHVLISKTNFDGYTETVQKAVRSDDQPDAGHQHRRPDLVSIYAPPQSDAEHNLASIWSDVLGIAKIGIDDNFFDIGGDSLIGAEVLNRINTAFGKQLPAVAIFDAPNIRSMAALLGEKVAASEPDTDASAANRRRRPRRRQLKDEL